MALFLFTKAIISGDPIKVFNNGKMLRDFTYIDDVIKSINLLIKNLLLVISIRRSPILQ